MISRLFSFVTWKLIHLLPISSSKSHHNLTLVVYFNWKVSFETVDMEDYHPTKKPGVGTLGTNETPPGSAAAAAMAGNSLGPSVMEAEDSRPLDIMDPLVAEDFQVRRFLGCWWMVVFFILMLDGYFFWRDVWRMSFDVMWKYSDEVFIFIFLFRFSGRGPHGWG